MAAARAADHSAAENTPRLVRTMAIANASACQASAKIGPSPRRSRGRSTSGRLKIALPEVDIDAVPAPFRFRPKLARCEGDRVERCGVTIVGRIRIRKDEPTPIGFDLSQAPARILR